MQAEDEPLAGTADEVDVWLLLEYRPAWPARAIEHNELAPDVRAWLDTGISALRELGLKVRPQFIRRPEIEDSDVQLFLHHAGDLRVLRGAYADLAKTPLVESVLEGAGELLREPHFFVCVNGRRDACCARFGLPVYYRLRQLAGQCVWQVTHLGGHRFAPNVLVLPDGLLYGRVAAPTGSDADKAAEVVEFHRQAALGQVSIKHLRGRSNWPQAAQAAEALARSSGRLPRGAASGSEPLALVSVEDDATGHAVTFSCAGQSFRFRVTQAAEPLSVLASCGDETTRAVRPYQAVD